jgi:NAD(P)H-dependent FMN reductase
LRFPAGLVHHVGYGGVAAARAIETLRGVVIELQMAPIKHELNIGMEPYLGIVRNGRSLNDYDYLVQSRGAMFDHLVWWGEALKAARQRTAESSRAA